jgi:uncharacterized protein (TIGR00251 family)
VSGLPGFLSDGPDGVRLTLKVQPRAKRNEIGVLEGDALKIKVTAPPVDSAANEAVIKMAAKRLGVAKGAIRILRGQTSRSKLVEVSGMSAREALAALGGGM